MSNLLHDAVFFVSVITIFAGMYRYSLLYCLKSKCQNFKLCYGFIQVERNIAAEIEIERYEIQHDLEKGNQPKIKNDAEEHKEEIVVD